MIPFHLITGFLGSGKTTFLKELLKQYADKQKIAVIQNEFADAGIDGRELQQTSWKFDLLEVNKGSVFCVCLFSDFREQLRQFIDQCKPDMVVLEATGLADPLSITELLTDAELQQRTYLAGVWCIADARNFRLVKDLKATRNQLLIADRILLNKSDLVEEAELEQLKFILSEINPLAEVKPTSFCNLPILLDDKKHTPQVVGEPSGPPAALYTSVYRSPYPVKRANLDYLLSLMNEDVFRLKGYVVTDTDETLMIQSVCGITNTLPVQKQPFGTEIIAIGRKKIELKTILQTQLINLKSGETPAKGKAFRLYQQ